MESSRAALDPLASLKLDEPVPPRHKPSIASESHADDEAWPQPARWPLILLGSYASAITLACLWLALTGRVQLRREAAEKPVAVESEF